MRILLAEDDRVSQRIARRALEGAGHEVEVADDGLIAWQRLLADPDRLLVTDLMMPHMDGIELIRRVRTGMFPAYIYILVVTALGDVDSLINGLELGADDYVAKPYDPRELVARVAVGERIVTLERDLQASRRAYRENATVDATTGLLNRRAAVARLREEVAGAADGGTAISIMLLSAATARGAATTTGCQPADTWLRPIASSLRGELRSYDAIGRWGGDDTLEILPGVPWGPEEVLVVLPGVDPSQAVAIIDRLRRSSLADGSTTPAFAAGLAGVRAGERPDTQEMLSRAATMLAAARNTPTQAGLALASEAKG